MPTYAHVRTYALVHVWCMCTHGCMCRHVRTHHTYINPPSGGEPTCDASTRAYTCNTCTCTHVHNSMCAPCAYTAQVHVSHLVCLHLYLSAGPRSPGSLGPKGPVKAQRAFPLGEAQSEKKECAILSSGEWALRALSLRRRE